MHAQLLASPLKRKPSTKTSEMENVLQYKGANEMASNFNHHTQHLGFVHAYGDAKTQYGQFKKRVVKVVHSDQVKEKYMINYSTLRSKTLIKLKNHTTPMMMLTKSSSVLKCCVKIPTL